MNKEQFKLLKKASLFTKMSINFTATDSEYDEIHETLCNITYKLQGTMYEKIVDFSRVIITRVIMYNNSDEYDYIAEAIANVLDLLSEDRVDHAIQITEQLLQKMTLQVETDPNIYYADLRKLEQIRDELRNLIKSQ